jgi:hypothetical protein
LPPTSVSDPSLRPTEGARFLLERISDDGDRATYRAVIYTPSREHATTATLAADGTVELGTLEPAAPADLADMLVMQARLLARSTAKRREDGLPAWPVRVLRWRGPGRGA